jgi:hypothetical protein
VALNGGAGVLIKFGGTTPEEFCEGRFNLKTAFDKGDIKRRDIMAGCLDAVEEELTSKP